MRWLLGAYRETPGPGWIANAVIRDCVISSVSVGGAGEPLYFNGIGSGSSVTGMKITGNKLFNTAGTAIMSSCGSLFNCAIENNMLIDVNLGIAFAGSDCCYDPCSWSTNWAKENIHVSDNLITVKSGGIGISMAGMSTLSDPRRHATNIVVKNNYVGAADSGAISGINFWQSDNITFEDNVIDSNGGNASSTDSTATFSSVRGNKTSAGNDVGIPGFNDDNSDQTIVFTPANGVGWYRLLKSWNREFSSSNIRITRKDAINTDNTWPDNAVLDLEFNYAVKAWTTDLTQLGEISVMQYNSWSATPPISQVRIGNSGGSQVVYVDLYLATYPLDKPLLIKSSG